MDRINPLRHMSLFDPQNFAEVMIHIVGDNLVARQVAYLIAKLGCRNITMYGEIAPLQRISEYVRYFTGVEITLASPDALTTSLAGVVLVTESSLQKRTDLYQNCLEMSPDVLQVLEVRTYNGDLPKVVTVAAAELFTQPALYESGDQKSWDNAIQCPLRSRIAATYLIGQFVVWSQITFKLEGKSDRAINAMQLIAGMAGLDAPSIGNVSLLTEEHRKTRLHVIGAGATGSHLVALLAECGFNNITVYDYDAIESHNIANQWFGPQQLDEKKTEALAKNIKTFYGLDITIRNERIDHTSQPLVGIVFLLVDKMASRKEIADAFFNRPEVPFIVETRMSSELSQVYATAKADYETWRASLFDEKVYKPEVSACGTSITIATTAKLCIVIAVSELVDYLTGGTVSASNTTSFYPPHLSAL